MAPPKQVLPRLGRPKGEGSQVTNIRLPHSLLARLDRYIAWLDTQTGMPANRAMVVRRALAEFLARQGEFDC